MDAEQPQLNSTRIRPLALIAFLATHILATLCVLFLLCAVVPKYIWYYELLQAELPAMTKQLVAITQIALDFWFLALLAIGLDALFLWMLGTVPKSRSWLPTAYSHLLLVAIIFFLVWSSIAIGLPLISGIKVLN